MQAQQSIDVQFTGHSSRKWRVSLSEDAFKSLVQARGEDTHGFFGEGSLFSPLLFGKFFDPADAFPLWDFEADSLLSGLPVSARGKVDWSETEADYVLKAELPGESKNDIEVSVENGKVLEIARQLRDSDRKDWKSGRWWEYGSVRRIELPTNANWKKTAAFIENNSLLEINIPKNNYSYSGSDESGAK